MTIDFNTPDFSNQLSTINYLLADEANIEVSLSFWGGRLVTIGGQSVLLNDLVQKIYETSLRCREGIDFSKETRLSGLSTCYQLQTLYTKTDALIKDAHWFTWLLVRIRECSLFSLSTQEHFKGSLENFRTYTKDRFSELYGETSNWDKCEKGLVVAKEGSMDIPRKRIIEVVTQSAKDVNLNDPNSWILEIRGKEFLLSLIDATKGLAKSYQDNFLRKLAQKQGHSEELAAAFKDRKLNLEEYLYPCTWNEYGVELGQVLFPHLSFVNVATVQARVNKQTSLCAAEHRDLLSNQITALDAFKEGRSERYFHLLQALLNFFIQHPQCPQNLKEAFLNHLLQVNFSQFKEMLPLELSTNIVSFIFDHASERQIVPFFEREIAPMDGEWRLLFAAFSCQLTNARKDQLFPILLKLGQSDENMLRSILLALGEMEYRSTCGYEEYVKINIFQFVSQMVHALYVANPDLDFWKEISERQSDSEAYATLNRALATIKICQSLSAVTENKLISVIEFVWPFQKGRGLDQIGECFEYVSTSMDVPEKQQAQLNILARDFAIVYIVSERSEQLLKILFKHIENVPIRTLVIDLIFRICQISDNAINVLDLRMPSKAQQVAYNRELLKVVYSSHFFEPERSFWLIHFASMPNMEEVFEEFGLNFTAYFKGPQDNPCSKEAFLFFRDFSLIASGEGLKRVIRKYQENEWCLQILWQGIILPDGRHIIEPRLDLEKRRKIFMEEGISASEAWTAPLKLLDMIK